MGRKKRSKFRSGQTQPRRPVYPRILIVCEGQTEEAYFKYLKTENRHPGVRVVRSKYTGLELVKEAKRIRQRGFSARNPYDHVYVVFDRDDYTKHPEAFATSEREKMKVIFSNPCFELWYLWHVDKYSTSPFRSSKDVVDKLKTVLPDYRKGRISPKLRTALNSNLAKALESAKRIHDYWNNHGDGAQANYNPKCNVDELVVVITSTSS